jgi:hypothetical protein
VKFLISQLRYIPLPDTETGGAWILFVLPRGIIISIIPTTELILPLLLALGENNNN